MNPAAEQAIERFAGASLSPGAEAIRARLRAIAAQMKPFPAGEPLWPGREALYEEVLRERGLIKDPPPEGEGS